MSGRGRHSGRDGHRTKGCGCGRRFGRGRGSGRGHKYKYAGVNSVSKKGLCSDLGNNVFDYRHKAAAEQMMKSWKNILQHVSTKYGHDLRYELHNKTSVNITAPVHSPQVLEMNATQEGLVRTVQNNVQAAL